MNADRQNRSPRVDRLPDERLRVTTLADVLNHIPKTPAGIAAAGLWLDWGTPHDTFTTCLLIKQDISGQEGASQKPVDEPPKLVRIFEEIAAAPAETMVGEPAVTWDQYDNKVITIDYLAFSMGTATYQVPGFTAAPAPNTDAILKTEERTNDGTLYRIQRVYTTGGILSDNEELRFGGRLKIRTIRSLNEIPATPAGYTLITRSTEYVRGLPLYTYGFANGSVADGNGGVVGTDIRYEQSANQGTTGATITTITYISDLSVSSNPITTPSGSVLIAVSYSDEGGFRTWRAIYAKGTGTVVTDVEIQNNGKLYLYHRVALGAAPSAPSATIGGTVTLISTDVRADSGYDIYDYRWAEGVGEIARTISYQQSENQGTLGVTLTNIEYLVAPAATQQPTSLAGSILIGVDFEDRQGVRIWHTRWAKGTGLVSQAIHARQDGLREVTNLALGTRSAPSGDVIRDDYRLDEGFTVFTVTSIQAKNGGDPQTSASTISFERYVPFLYPGRAKRYFITASNGWKAYDVFRSPPVKADVKATVTVSYQTGNTLGTISDYWNPTEWATIQAEWIGLNNLPGFALVSLPGYRTTSATPLVFTASIWEDGVAGTMLGNIVFGGTIAQLTVTGGPADPGGSTFTLDATIEPAYTTSTGTVVYRKTLVSAAIPAQAALPV